MRASSGQYPCRCHASEGRQHCSHVNFFSAAYNTRCDPRSDRREIEHSASDDCDTQAPNYVKHASSEGLGPKKTIHLQ